jgi:hypothetical protein
MTLSNVEQLLKYPQIAQILGLWFPPKKPV